MCCVAALGAGGNSRAPSPQLPHLQGLEILLFLPFMGLEPGSCKSVGSTNELALEKIHLILPLPGVL